MLRPTDVANQHQGCFLTRQKNGTSIFGDRASDVECGRAAGTRSVFVDLGYTDDDLMMAEADVTVSGIAEAVDWICADAARRGD